MEYVSCLQKLAENLITTYQNTIFSHSGNKGDTREKVVIDYLTRAMPHKYGFQSGEIFDEGGMNSGQVDLIIYDALFSTVFTDGTNKILAPVESTYGIVSVKSKMGIKELDNAIEGIKRYDALSRPKAKEGFAYIMPDFAIEAGQNIKLKGTNQQNINCIFAFDTTVAKETVLQKIQHAGCVDLLVVPGKFCVIGRRRSEFGLDQANQALFDYIILSDKSISIFVLFLQLYLSGNKLIAGDIRNYTLWLAKQSKLIT